MSPQRETRSKGLPGRIQTGLELCRVIGLNARFACAAAKEPAKLPGNCLASCMETFSQRIFSGCSATQLGRSASQCCWCAMPKMGICWLAGALGRPWSLKASFVPGHCRECCLLFVPALSAGFQIGSAVGRKLSAFQLLVSIHVAIFPVPGFCMSCPCIFLGLGRLRP